jgi:sec-independent protein translocase protein TatA
VGPGSKPEYFRARTMGKANSQRKGPPMSTPVVPMIAGLGPSEVLILIVVIVVLLFGAKKLPELARGSGRALRIFKAETKGLMDDDDVKESEKTEAQRQLEAQRRAEAEERLRKQPEPPRSDTER